MNFTAKILPLPSLSAQAPFQTQPGYRNFDEASIQDRLQKARPFQVR